ncbi:MAG: hypothetical protein MUE56_05365 [Ignavibacteria bacterium]|jgi:hypothetical protein|nr:hypothetical protein [Ignavibacteria bacterium]
MKIESRRIENRKIESRRIENRKIENMHQKIDVPSREACLLKAGVDSA